MTSEIDLREAAELLEAMGGVLLEGPRGCGKTSTALNHARSSIRLDAAPEMRELAALDPGALLTGPPPPPARG